MLNTEKIDLIVKEMILAESKKVLSSSDYTQLSEDLDYGVDSVFLEEGILDTIKDKVSKVVFNKISLKVNEYAGEVSALKNKLNDSNVSADEAKQIELIIAKFEEMQREVSKTDSLNIFMRIIVEIFKIGLIIGTGVVIMVLAKRFPDNPILVKIQDTARDGLAKLYSFIKTTDITSISKNSVVLTSILKNNLSGISTVNGKTNALAVPGYIEDRLSANLRPGLGKHTITPEEFKAIGNPKLANEVFNDPRTASFNVTAFDNDAVNKLSFGAGIFIVAIQVMRSIKAIVSNGRNRDSAQKAVDNFGKEFSKFKSIKA